MLICIPPFFMIPGQMSGEDWEEKTMIVELNGVMETESLIDAIENGQCVVRHVNSATPLVQVANSVFTGNWVTPLTTDLILQVDGRDLVPVSVSDMRLKAEKALLVPVNETENKSDK